MWRDTINYVCLCSANQLQLWTKPLHASYHIIDFDLAKAEKIYDQSFFFTSLQLCEMSTRGKKQLNQSVSQSISKPASQSVN